MAPRRRLSKLALALSSAVASAAPISPMPPAAAAGLTVGWVGNSYIFFHELPELVSRLAASSTPPLIISHDSVTVGGSSLSRLAENGAVQILLRRGWDYVVLQDQSQIPGGARPLDRLATLRSLREFYGPELMRAGSRALFYSTWGRRDGDSAHPDVYPDFQTMNDLTTAGYELYQAELGASPPPHAAIAPVGAAFARIHEEYDVSIFEELYDPDGSHPSIVGSYLAACVFYVRLTGLRSSGLPYVPHGMTRAQAAFYQGIADSVVLSATEVSRT